MVQLKLSVVLAAATLLPIASSLPRHIANITALHPPPQASHQQSSVLVRRQIAANAGFHQFHNMPNNPWLTQYPAWWPPYNTANCDPTQGPAHFLPMGCEERFACKLGAGLHDKLVAEAGFDRIWGDTWACDFFQNAEVKARAQKLSSMATKINKQYEREKKERWRKKLKTEKEAERKKKEKEKEEEKEIEKALGEGKDGK